MFLGIFLKIYCKLFVVTNDNCSVYLIDDLNNRLYMEQIIGQTLKQFLWTNLGVSTNLLWL
jgi:tRNA A-37 threonylcarbamoyl transferase component Bud32